MESVGARLRRRVKQFAIRAVKFKKALPAGAEVGDVFNQFVRSATGMSANYHAACRGRSRRDFISDLCVVVKEADETEHWLEIIVEANLAGGPELVWLRQESAELRAIFIASLATARRNAGSLQDAPARRPAPNSREDNNS